MKNKWFCYIKIDEPHGFIRTSGISWNEFYCGIEPKPQNLLLLSGYPHEGRFCGELDLEYIDSGQMAEFAQSYVYGYGDFCWVDFDDSARLPTVSDQDLAAMLFFSHRSKPLQSFKIGSLQNRYAYYSHDDDCFVKVYMDNPGDYQQVVQYKILKELKGRKRSLEPIPPDVMHQLLGLFKEGAVLDFEESTNSGVMIYPIGDILDTDEIHTRLDRRRSMLDGVSLEYNTRTKKWHTCVPFPY